MFLSSLRSSRSPPDYLFLPLSSFKTSLRTTTLIYGKGKTTNNTHHDFCIWPKLGFRDLQTIFGAIRKDIRVLTSTYDFWKFKILKMIFETNFKINYVLSSYLEYFWYWLWRYGFGFVQMIFKKYLLHLVGVVGFWNCRWNDEVVSFHGRERDGSEGGVGGVIFFKLKIIIITLN